MAKYPVDSSEDSQGLVDAVNYALSGPAGLGQNFSGFASSDPIYVRPTGRQPFTLPVTTTLDPSWYLSTPITTITTVGSNPTAVIQATFATAFADPPFQMGDVLAINNTVANSNDIDFYNRRYTVIACTTTTVDLALRVSFQPVQQNWPGLYVNGGLLIRDYYDIEVSTDCNGRVSVQGGSDRVFINSQLLLDVDYTKVSGYGLISATGDIANVIGNNFELQNLTSTQGIEPGIAITATDGTGSMGTGPITVTTVIDDTTLLVAGTGGAAAGTVTNVIGDFVQQPFEIVVTIDRYKGFPNTEPGSVDYFFTFDGYAAIYTWPFSDSTSGSITDLETVFVSVIERNLPFGYYWYLLDINFKTLPGYGGDLGGLISNVTVTNDSFTPSGTAANLGSLTNYAGIAPTTVTGVGSGAELAFDIYPGGGAYSFATNLTVYVTNPGLDYAVGDTLLITGDQLGGATPANDLTLVVEDITAQTVKPGPVKAKLRSLTAQVVKE